METAYRDCWASRGNHVVSRSEPSSTPERAMEHLRAKVQLIHGDQDWSAWTWEAREYGTGTRAPRSIRFTWRLTPSPPDHPQQSQ